MTLTTGTRIGLLEILEVGPTKARCLCHGCSREIFRDIDSLTEAVKRKYESSCKKCRTRPRSGARFGSVAQR